MEAIIQRAENFNTVLKKIQENNNYRQQIIENLKKTLTGSSISAEKAVTTISDFYVKTYESDQQIAFQIAFQAEVIENQALTEIYQYKLLEQQTNAVVSDIAIKELYTTPICQDNFS